MAGYSADEIVSIANSNTLGMDFFPRQIKPILDVCGVAVKRGGKIDVSGLIAFLLARQKKEPKAKGKKAQSTTDERYEKKWIVNELLDTAENETGITKITALKELARKRETEPPPVDENIQIAFVPIKFVDKQFYASLDEAKII